MMLRFGGHKQAAGLQIESARIKEFRQADQRLGRSAPVARRSAAAAVARRAADVRPHHQPGRRGAGDAGAVRPGQPQAGLSHLGRADRRRPAQAEGAAPQDVVPPGRPHLPRHRLERRRARRRARPRRRTASSSRSRSRRTSSRASVPRAARRGFPLSRRLHLGLSISDWYNRTRWHAGNDTHASASACSPWPSPSCCGSSIGERPGADAAATVERLDPKADVGDSRRRRHPAQGRQARHPGRVRQPGALQRWPQPSSRLQGASSTIAAAARSRSPATKRAVGPEQSAYDVDGNVTLKTSDGLTVDDARKPRLPKRKGCCAATARCSSSANARRAPASGSPTTAPSIGCGCSIRRSINVAPATDGSGAMQVNAGSADYSRAERFMRFERGMRMERQGQVIEAVDSTVFLLRDRDEPETRRAARRTRRSPARAAPARCRAWQARDINLHYAADGRTLEQALLVGPVGDSARRARTAGRASSCRRRIDRRVARAGRRGHSL